MWGGHYAALFLNLEKMKKKEFWSLTKKKREQNLKKMDLKKDPAVFEFWICSSVVCSHGHSTMR